jgi:branched-chain amino acid transport system substrate-binding protein
MKLGLLTAAIFAAAIASAATSAQAEVKFGVAGPITGANAAFGAQLTNGASMAIEDVNAAGGILGQKIVLEQGDDVSDPKARRLGRQ